ncbi:hypothetical protein COV16_06110, partial [Candidatus Woesearchaeota archaeon CG10_big_fil_rev_8_21_14_0_10_34_8]
MIFYKENKSKNELTKLLFNWPLWLIGFSFCLGFVFYQLIIQKKIEGIVKRYNHFENMVKTAFQYHSTPPNRLVIHTAVSLRNSFKQKKDYGENTTLLEQPISAQLFYDNHFYDLKIDPNQKE